MLNFHWSNTNRNPAKFQHRNLLLFEFNKRVIGREKEFLTANHKSRRSRFQWNHAKSRSHFIWKIAIANKFRIETKRKTGILSWKMEVHKHSRCIFLVRWLKTQQFQFDFIFAQLERCEQFWIVFSVCTWVFASSRRVESAKFLCVVEKVMVMTCVGRHLVHTLNLCILSSALCTTLKKMRCESITEKYPHVHISINIICATFSKSLYMTFYFALKKRSLRFCFCSLWARVGYSSVCMKSQRRRRR